ncbi:MAG: hypothetical protein RMZ42_13865 [Nostoc sp. DedQUE05]|uniref:hypothetical protein n=1 Tax=Nostoc sp. DedQUE05 TaxID=3075391 RepID=UPI002AD273AF|nr:hypothetical protein [Nostoc sp. DedQUE05]MDZ8092997.1 hypothetical protein [Nostoc sp. DedQUE05]
MSIIKIYSVVGIQSFTLVVFNTQRYFWEFRLVSADGAVFGEQRLYYTPKQQQKPAESVFNLTSN